MSKVPFLSFLFATIWVTYYGLFSTEFYAKYSTPITIVVFVLTAVLVNVICSEFCKLDSKLEDLETRLDELEKKSEEEE